MDKLILDNGDYVRVYENCPIRKGWIIVLQVSKSDWNKPQYNNYR
jgi:hypothetical protein